MCVLPGTQRSAGFVLDVSATFYVLVFGRLCWVTSPTSIRSHFDAMRLLGIIMCFNVSALAWVLKTFPYLFHFFPK